MERNRNDSHNLWDQKRYHSLDYELKKQFGQKVYKLSLNG
ncbi:MAG TPA: TIGR01212 family radical SAM protein, partial [Mobilitalea sp.]|nr:TIGR01212 family radical SAM protein [Mobilitalea sp.]